MSCALSPLLSINIDLPSTTLVHNRAPGPKLQVAVEKCAEDTKGQTCYICTQARHWKTKEGLVRGCACRGTAGFAHVSCLAEQAKILMDEALENNLDWEVKNHLSLIHISEPTRPY